ncbi:MAG: sensor domain-containing diguanylate cyclase [Pseudomonadota bacterium]
MRRLSISGATTLAVILIGGLFILLSWFAGSYLREAALQSQSQSLSRVIEVATDQVLLTIQQQAIELHGTLNEGDSLTRAFRDYQQGVEEPILALLDDPLLNGYAGAVDMDLVKFRLYDLELNFLLESRAGNKGLNRNLPGFLALKAGKREGADRLKAIGGLWLSAQGPLYSMLLPVGGLHPEGYLEFVIDPTFSLSKVGEITRMPLNISLAAQASPVPDNSLDQSALLPIEYLLIGEDRQPAYRLVGLEDVSTFKQDMQNQQVLTTVTFITITFMVLMLVLLLLNRGIFMPLKNMLGGIEYYRRGELDCRISPSGLREIFTLGETFNTMIEQIQHDINELERYSNLDGLTGLSNRRYFEQRLQEEWSRSTRQQVPIALLFIDIDYFKRYNDHYGHLQGDDCLRRVAAAIQHAVKRDIDVAARYGGEEFVIMLPETDISGAEQVARELQKAIRKLHIEHSGSNVEPFITLSIGIASQIPSFPDKADVLLKSADAALYQAKGHGRNCIEKFPVSA